jgi:hypothetical protein
MHRVLVSGVAVAVALMIGAGAALAEPSGPAAPTGSVKHDKRCSTVTALIPTATSVATGNTSNVAKQARVLRELADRELTPRKVKAALRKLADWFAAARDRSVGERALKLAALKSQIAVIVIWGGKICGEPIVTTTSSTLPNLVPQL